MSDDDHVLHYFNGNDSSTSSTRIKYCLLDRDDSG